MKTLFRGLMPLVMGVTLATALPATAPLNETQRAWVSKAHRHEKSGWTYLHVEGAAKERGFQHGYLLAREIAGVLRAERAIWHYQTAMEWDWLVSRAAAMFTPKLDAECLAELEGITEGLQAAGVRTTLAEVITSNGWIELSWYWWPQELKKIKEGAAIPVRQSCSSFIATGSMTTNRGVVLAHNTMMGYEDAPPNVIIDILPRVGRRILMQTWPGWIHSGTDFFVTDAGLVGSETTIGGFEGFDTNGIPEFVRMRRATQTATSIDQWCAIMKSGNNGGYANAWLLGDVNSGEIARLELGLKYVGFERKKDGYFTGSNIAEDLRILRFETSAHETDIRNSDIARRVRWKQLMAQSRGRIDVKLAQLFEADHFDAFQQRLRAGGRSLCGHFELDADAAGAWPGVPYGPSGTVDAKVVDTRMAKSMRFAARWGSACGMAFDAPKFLSDHPQFDWMRGILRSRPSQPWTEFGAGERQ
jgi:hypothetical protein